MELTSQAIEQFEAALRGRVIRPRDVDYEEARKIWNAMIDKRPALIVQCAGVADVMNAVQFARKSGLPTAIRGGGHNIAGSALCDGGIVIDLSGMRDVRIDPVARRAYVGPGASLGDLDHESQAFGLATTTGINSTTGVAGLTLGGGFGWLSRKYGHTVDNLVSAEVITATGERLVASEKENSDLFWGLRGGGANLAVVTQFEFALHPVGPGVIAGLIVFPLAQADRVLPGYRELMARAPDDLTVWAVLRKAPPLPFLPEDVHGTDILALACFFDGDAKAAEPHLSALRRLGTPIGSHVGPVPYAAWQQAFDPLLTPGERNYWKSHNFTALSDGLFATTVEHAKMLPDPQCEIFIAQLGGASGRVAGDAMAYAHRDVKFVMNVHGRWSSPDKDEVCVGWARRFFAAAAPFATGGVYVNFMPDDEEERVHAAYGSNYDRLAKLKRKYDPQNLFRINQNITPA